MSVARRQPWVQGSHRTGRWRPPHAHSRFQVVPVSLDNQGTMLSTSAAQARARRTIRHRAHLGQHPLANSHHLMTARSP